ncbi:MAG: 4Fe-4S binding protein [Acidobacteriia bacterium]|nr:4Fe-4S binding protein [Terriglobia bacterium]
MISQLQEWAAERGFRVACGGVRVLHEVRAELARQRSTGELHANFCTSNLDFFRYEDSSESIADVKAVIVVAVPRPAHRLTFELETGPFEVTLPPTYVRYSGLFQEVRDDITSKIPELHGHLEVLVAPLKSVACRLGLVTYGRNNLTYIPDWGSYFQLVGYVTDENIALADDWRPKPLRLMPECESCGICSSACPTGAINDERILLHAELCTTLFSEQPGDLNHALSADCLFGCLDCQQICPANSGLLRIESAGVTFDRRETEAILSGDGAGACDTTESVTCKLALLGLTEEAHIGRNLAHLIVARRLSRQGPRNYSPDAHICEPPG